MKRFTLIAILISLLMVSSAKAQTMDTIYKYIVFFKDKNNSSFSLTHPEEFLSERALARRQRQNILVQPNDIPVNYRYIDSVLTKGVTYLNRSRWLNSLTVQADSDTSNISRIRTLPFVKNIIRVSRLVRIVKKNNNEANNVNDSGIICQGKSSQVNNNLNSSAMSYPVYNYGKSFDQVHMLGGDVLHSQGFRGEGVLIAVQDAGFWKVDKLSAFDSLWLNNQIIGVKDFVEPWENVFKKSTHGMMVLSIIAGNIPGQLLGTGPKASFLLLRSEDAGSETMVEEYNWVAAAEYADSTGADIISSSLGYTTFDDSTQNHTYSMMDGNTTVITKGAKMAAEKGILVVNSAGNSADKPWHYIGAPADADSILACAAVGSDREYASFSSVGPTSDGRIKPDVSSMGYGTFIASTTGGISSGSGTSFSAPLIAGMCACLWQANPLLSNMEIIRIIKESSDRYSKPDNYYGFGIPNFSVANMIAKNINIHDLDNENQVNIYPNPFYNNIYMMFSSLSARQVIVELFDINGQRIYYDKNEAGNSGYNSIVVDNLDYLPDGLYLVRLSSGDKVSTCKVLKKAFND